MMLTINLLRNSLGMQMNQRICPKKDLVYLSLKSIISYNHFSAHDNTDRLKDCSPPPLQECSHNDKWSCSCEHMQLSARSIYGDLRTYE